MSIVVIIIFTILTCAMELKQGNSSVSRFTISLCSFIIPVDNYGSQKCGCLAGECLYIAPKLHIPVHKEWSKIWMLASLLVSQATTHILIENDQVTVFPLINKWQCLATLAEDTWAGKPGATAGVGHSTLRTHMCTHTHAPALDCAPFQLSSFKDAAADSRILLPSLPVVISPSPHAPCFWAWAAVSATRTDQLFPSPPLLLWKVI